MKKYIRATVCLASSLVRFSLIKLLKFKTFKFTWLNIVSPFSEIEINGNGALSLGKNLKIRSGSKIRVRKNARLEIGENVSLNHGCIFTCHEYIKIGNDVQFGPNVLIYDHDHDFRKKNGLKELFFKTSPVQIGNNVWIGANVVILRGSKIGDNCVIAAGSIIKGSFNDNSVVIQKREDSVIKIEEI